MGLQLSVSEILNSVEGLETTKFDQLYRELYALRLQRNSGVSILNEEESQLLSRINTEFDQKKWERLTYLDWKLEFSALSEKEDIESLKLAEAFENYSVERLKYLSKLAIIRQVSIDKLIEQLGINAQFNG
jgi:polyphosphate kinase